jgi:exodeoxyribonuclease VII small subunit
MSEAADVSALSFEAALEQLERIVGQLESGSVSLEDSIGLYTKGVALKQHCEAKLADAQARIEKIQVGADGKPKGTVPLDAQ